MSVIKNMIPAGMEDDFDDFECYNPILKTTQNMKITIVEDITQKAGLNGENFDATLAQDIDKWFQEYKTMWNIYKKTPTMAQSLQTLFLTNENPLLLALQLFANCPGCDNIKTKNLAYFVLETICNLKKEKTYISENCTDNTKMVAFNFVKTQGIPNIYKAVTETYELKKSNELFPRKIRELINNHFYKDASYWAAYLDLSERFSIYDVPLPLILQDKISIAEEYLDVAKILQIPTIELLDSFLGGNSSVINNCDIVITKFNYPDIRREKLYHKPLTKLIVRLSKKYNIPSESTPNVNHSKSFGYLQYLVHKKYIEKCMSNDAWRELIREFVISKELQSELISLICLHNDSEEAYYWTKCFKIPKNEWLSQVQEYFDKKKPFNLTAEDPWDDDISLKENKKSKNENDFDDNCEQPIKFYKKNLTKICIKLVDTKQKFCDMLHLLQYEKIIAFDSEWKPSFKGDALVNLIQLANRKKIFLIDVLSEEINASLWKKLGEIVFNNNDILKLGFSLHHDLIMFHKALPYLNINLSNNAGYFDLQDAWRKLKEMRGFKFPHKTLSSSENLCSLVELCCGKQLDKSNQFSNWANRPLRKEQIVYAALDAYCLLEIYDVISRQLFQMHINIDHFVENIILESNNKSQKSKKKIGSISSATDSKSNKEPIESPFKETVRVDTIQFVCDEMLGGLTKALRKIGIDCIIIKKDTDDAAKIAIQENRFLLTKCFRYVKLVQYLPYGHCYEIKSNQVDEQLIEVLKFFKIVLLKEDIFSRCKICNCNEFILATKFEMKKMKYGNYEKVCLKKPKLRDTPPLRNFKIKKITPVIFALKATETNHPIQVHKIPDHIIDTVDYFYICQGCGKCYWDGSHLENFLNGFLKDFIEM